MKTVTALIDLAALDNNMSIIKKYAQDSALISVVKANAYGHGVKECAGVIDKYAQGYAVARLEEAIELRQLGITKDIVLLGGFFSEDDLPLIEEYDLSFAVHSFWQIDAINKYAPKKLLKAWCQTNIGMERLGFNDDELIDALEQMSNSPYLVKPINLMSHLSCADTKAQTNITNKQLSTWQKMSNLCKGKFSLTNSAALLNFTAQKTDYIRPGIIQYGANPANEMNVAQYGFKPVMSLYSKVIKVRTLKPGDVVGYGAAWTCTASTRIAIVAAGYADGYPRAIPNGTKVYINGAFYQTVGHVCMDMLFVDIGNNDEIKVGDKVELWGEHVSVDYLASLINTIGYELLTGLTNRVEYQYKR